MDEIKRIAASELPEVEKLAQAFRCVTDRIVEDSQRELELLRALGDPQAVLKEQVKLSTIQHARSVFAQCHLMVTGRKAWDE